MDDSKDLRYLTCEKYYVFEMLILVAGMMGAYTFNLRGGVFCNAQTANIVLMGIAFGKGYLGQGFYYLIPLSAYIAGTIISELFPKKVRKIHFLRWDTYLIGFEILSFFLIGFIPLSTPVQIVQVMINFICSMQYNTFRQAEGIPMATTFLTNHIRQIGVWLTKAVVHKQDGAWKIFSRHFRMVAFFFLGGFILTLFCDILKEKSIWLAMIPLMIIFVIMSIADRTQEKEYLSQKPHGH